MVKYTCKNCNYSSGNKANYSKHCNTIKHKKKVMETRNIDTIQHLSCTQLTPAENSIVKVNKHVCEYCDTTFSRKSSVIRHYKICTEKIKEDNVYKLKLQNEKEKTKRERERTKHAKENAKHERDKMEMYKREAEYYKEMLNIAGGLVQKSVSSLTHVINTYDEAPIIKEIQFTDIPIETEKLISEIFHHYNCGSLDRYIGDIIVAIYKTKDPAKQAVWNTDTSRLTYLIRKIIYDNQPKWIVDKKGVETMDYLITPLIKQIRTLAAKYQADQCLKNIDTDNYDIVKVQLINDIFGKLIKDIDSKKIHNNILKYISPHFFVSNKNLIEN